MKYEKKIKVSESGRARQMKNEKRGAGKTKDKREKTKGKERGRPGERESSAGKTKGDKSSTL
jgi:hypothetical protein